MLKARPIRSTAAPGPRMARIWQYVTEMVLCVYGAVELLVSC